MNLQAAIIYGFPVLARCHHPKWREAHLGGANVTLAEWLAAMPGEYTHIQSYDSYVGVYIARLDARAGHSWVKRELAEPAMVADWQEDLHGLMRRLKVNAEVGFYLIGDAS